MAISAINGVQVSSPQPSVKNNKKTVSKVPDNNKLEKSPRTDTVAISKQDKKELNECIILLALGIGAALIADSVMSKGKRMSSERIAGIADSITDDCIL